MCLIFLSYKQNEEYPFIALANRDEFYRRPTLQANYWEENPNILAGKDLEAGGTWMGITKNGHMAMLTNYRDIPNIKQNAPTRGKLVSDYLAGEFDPKSYLLALTKTANQYNGYNLIVGTFDDPWYYSNYQQKKVVQLGSGLYGLSNQLLDSNWPKIEKGKERLSPLMIEKELNIESLFTMMTDKEVVNNDALLPSTGLPLDRERSISSMFIDTEGYGTRATTLVTVNRSGEVTFIERLFENGMFTGVENKYQFEINK